MNILTRLQSCHAAEDFFRALDLPFDQAVINVSRLHILKRMGQYLRREVFDGLEDSAVRERCRSALADAYRDFTTSTPIEQRVFKVHQDAVKPKEKPKPAFIPLTALTSAPATI